MTAQQKRKKRRKALWAKIKARVKAIKTLDVILVVVFLLFLWFNHRMLAIYEVQGSIPESYAIAVISSLIGECGICGWIRTSKTKHSKSSTQDGGEEGGCG